MTNARVFSLAWVALSVTWLGCYDPNVPSGYLKCTPSSNACPEGLTCSGGVCVTMAVDGGMCTKPVQTLCALPPLTGAVCDPVCQTGCGCGLGCSVATSGAVMCSAPLGSKVAGQVCSPSLDDCQPGFACLKEACGNNLGRCYRYCREGDATVCGAQSACRTPVELPNGTDSKQRVCDLAPQACDPVAGTGCPDPALKCYASSTTTTVCDCPARALTEGADCSSYNDCATGLACLTVGNRNRCVRLCRSTADCGSCMGTGTVKFCQ
ncbi:MAG TPA: hypothetical protein VHU40_18370 [Polyangia bacterium]|jgi:hypothetical protein|nr:hypothetical protein [Polyangia bacterium]